MLGSLGLGPGLLGFWESLGRWALTELLLMIELLHYLKDPKVWELWYIPYDG